jgi:phosphoribosylamine-glycine ligase
MKVLVIDSYFLLDQILRFVEDGHDVYFYNTLMSSTQAAHIVDIYSGLDKYFTRVDDYGEVIDKVDLVYFTDMYFPDLAQKFKDDGIPVYGPTPDLVRMEDDREYGHKEMKKLGIQVPNAEYIEGLDNLLKYVKGKKEKLVIKLDSRYRENAETFIVEGYEDALMQLAKTNLGPYLKDMKFFVQEFIEGVEIGADMFISRDKMVLPYGFTLEIKLGGGCKGNIGIWSYKEGSIREFFERMLPKTKKDDYRCSLSYEAILTKKGPYILEPTSRNPYPVFGMYARYMENFSEVIYGVATGKPVDVKFPKDKPVMGQVVVSIGTGSDWTEVEFEEHDPLKEGITMKDGFGFNRVIVKDGKYWIPPEASRPSIILNTFGTDVDEIIEKSKELLEDIEATDYYYYPRVFKEMKRRVEELEEYSKDFHFEVGTPKRTRERERIELPDEVPSGEIDLSHLKRHIHKDKNYTALVSYEGEMPSIEFDPETGDYYFRRGWVVIFDSANPAVYPVAISSRVLGTVKKASLEDRSILRSLENEFGIKLSGVAILQESYIEDGTPHIRDIILVKKQGG